MHPYVRFPAVHGDHVVFVSDDDLWSTRFDGGSTRRLTANQGVVSHPVFSPNGRCIATLSTRDGVAEVYVSDADGGAPVRLTWGSQAVGVCGFTPDGEHIVYSSAKGRPSAKEAMLWQVPVAGGPCERLDAGLGRSWAQDGDDVALARHEEDLARWKRYRGGRAGVIWFRTNGTFRRLDVGTARAANPMWVDGRLWFVSDRGYTANLWSVDRDGEDLRQETLHGTYAVRHASTDGRRIVYACGAELWALVPGQASGRIELDHRAPAERMAQRHVGMRYLERAAIHPDGRSLALIVRGKALTIGTFEGSMQPVGERHGVRYRLLSWFDDGERLAVVSDASGEDTVGVFDGGEHVEYPVPDLGRPTSLAVAPGGERIAVTDDRGQVAVITPGEGSVVIEKSGSGRCSGLSWSSDGRWLVYSRPVATNATSAIRLWGVDGTFTDLTDGRFADTSPSFDPEGRFVAFLSNRDFVPVYDQAFFDVNFPASVRPYLLMLRPGEPTPLVPSPMPVGGKPDTPKAAKTVDIDVDGIRERVVRMPMPARRYLSVTATLGGLVAASEPVEPTVSAWKTGGVPPARRALHLFHWASQAESPGLPRHTGYGVSANGKALLLRVGNRLRVVPFPAPEKKLPTGNQAGRKTGWFDANRVTVPLQPRQEWEQMLRETWRWMRDHFWTPDHSGVDWAAMWERYRPLLDRVASRGEYADLVWEMVGELGTSHAYEMMGDYRRLPGWRVGTLAAEFDWQDGWTVARIARGEPGLAGGTSPLLEPGVDVREGDVIEAVDGLPLDIRTPVERALVDRGGKRVSLRVRSGDAVRTVEVLALRNDSTAWYRAWVRANRERVHEETGGRVGYVHIPDMGPTGYADFHRDYLLESTRDALVVDVRYNGGGHVSQLILEKLRRRPIAYNQSRWDGVTPYPAHSMVGPMVAITNEMAGSDGDIFSHAFKMYELGPLVGTRTWGGVIGIWPRARHADGSITTQPEFSYWFEDVGFKVENYGTDPDIEVVMHPEHYGRGEDPQLERALACVLDALKTADGHPDLGERPYLGAPQQT